MNDLWMKDIMTQNFINSDATRLIMLDAFTSKGELLGVYKKSDIMEYIYRVYTDYPEVSKINPDSRIRNIKWYGISDVKHVLDICLNEWKQNAANDTLVFDDRYIYIKDIGNDGRLMCKYTRQMSQMLKKKYFSVDFGSPLDVDVNLCKDDKNIEVFGKSIYRNRVFEDVQYCPLCEEVDTDNLFAVHILDSKYCDNDEELIDKSNGLIMCREHAMDYLDNRFVFKENGFVENISSSIVSEKMHLSICVKSRKRKNYIRRKYTEFKKVSK